MTYIEFEITSNFSFLRSGSHPEELVAQAAALGYQGIGIADWNTLAGVVRAYEASKEAGIRAYTGVRLLVLEGLQELQHENILPFHILCYPKTLSAYQQLSSLLSLGKQRCAAWEMRKDSRGPCPELNNCILEARDLSEYLEDCACIFLLPEYSLKSWSQRLLRFQRFASKLLKTSQRGNSFFLALTRRYENIDPLIQKSSFELAELLTLPLIATNDVRFHDPSRKALCDAVTCIREKCTLQEAGFRLLENAERQLKEQKEMERLFQSFPSALQRTETFARLCEGFSLELLRYHYPSEICPQDRTPQAYLRELCEKGLLWRFPEGASAKVQQLLREELALIRELDYEKYFLTCYDIVQFARKKGILCQGRGAAANSLVCYLLGITSVNPEKIDLLFARFVSKERNEPPDIDIDFEHERREEVIQYIYEKYGRERAALVCEVVSYKARSAIRDLGKVFGFPQESVDRLAKSIHRWTGASLARQELLELGFDPDNHSLQKAIAIAQELKHFPRHLSQHVGGFIISEKPLHGIVPILPASMENRSIIEWDKNDIEALGMLKIDVLALGMLSCIRKAFALIEKLHGRKLSLADIPPEDPDVYDRICRADTLGVFQIESRAQMSMLPRLKPRCYYDLVIEVAIVRPGPIHGDMVHPYLRRRNGFEKVEYPDEEVRGILGKTLGVPIFQEQAMRLAIALANFSPGEAEQLRRAMAAWKTHTSKIAEFQKRIVEGMLKRGYSEQFAVHCVNQLRGFSEYGFPESHAASFALLVYVSAWLKHHYPAEFAASLLNSQPMGFYAPSQILRDAEARGVRVLPIDVQESAWDATVYKNTLRCGLREVKGLQQEQAEIFMETRRRFGVFRDLQSFWSCAFELASEKGLLLQRSSLQALARADALKSFGLSRREALWKISRLPKKLLPLEKSFPGLLREKEKVQLQEAHQQLSMFQDYEQTGFSLQAHPVSFIRPYLKSRNAFSAAELLERKKERNFQGLFVKTAGLALFRQRPGTSKGVVFVTLEDETGMINLIIRPNVFERYTKIILSSSFFLASGICQRVAEEDSSKVLYLLVTHLESLDELSWPRESNSLPGRSYSY